MCGDELAPNPAATCCFLAHSFSPLHLPALQSLWALARLGLAPPAPWLTAAMTRLQQTASMFAPVEVSQVSAVPQGTTTCTR